MRVQASIVDKQVHCIEVLPILRKIHECLQQPRQIRFPNFWTSPHHSVNRISRWVPDRGSGMMVSEHPAFCVARIHAE